MQIKSYYKSPLGNIILTSDGEFLKCLCFETSRYKDSVKLEKLQVDDNLEIFNLSKRWLDRYFNGENPNPKEVPIKLEGTEFSHKVWEEIKVIPYGKTITYGEIAKSVAKKSNMKAMSAQAVGHAVGHNPVAIIVPCHRVVGANGNLTGYDGGIDKKVALLQLEKVNMTDFYIPSF